MRWVKQQMSGSWVFSRPQTVEEVLGLRPAPAKPCWNEIPKICTYKCLVCSVLRHGQLLVTPRTVAQQEYWSRLPFSPLTDLPSPGIEPESPAAPWIASGFFTCWAIGEIHKCHAWVVNKTLAEKIQEGVMGWHRFMASPLQKISSPIHFPFPLQPRDKDEVNGFCFEVWLGESNSWVSPSGACLSHLLSDAVSLVLYLYLSTCLSLNQCQFLILLVIWDHAWNSRLSVCTDEQ